MGHLRRRKFLVLVDTSPEHKKALRYAARRAQHTGGIVSLMTVVVPGDFQHWRSVEDAMREENTPALVIPAHTIKGEARQLGAEPLAKVAELIESTARLCVETHRFPDELIPQVVELRQLFDQTVEMFDKATNPLMTRSGSSGFGRKVNNQNFGRI